MAKKIVPVNDRIHLKNLILPTVIGVSEGERALPQTVSVNATLFLDTRAGDMGDDLANAVDYFSVSVALRKVAAAGERKLIETLAEDFAREILSFHGVRKTRVEVEKFILPNCGAVSVEITRRSEVGGRKSEAGG